MLLNLPPELLKHGIAPHLNFPEILNLALSCRQLLWLLEEEKDNLPWKIVILTQDEGQYQVNIKAGWFNTRLTMPSQWRRIVRKNRQKTKYFCRQGIGGWILRRLLQNYQSPYLKFRVDSGEFKILDILNYPEQTTADIQVVRADLYLGEMKPRYTSTPDLLMNLLPKIK